MRKIIYLSQRVDIHPDYNETRDALDQRWAALLWQAGYLALPVFNHRESMTELLEVHPPSGILLTGGNSPESYGGTAPERDEADKLLIDYAEKNKIPLLGVCRGMQSVVLFFGGSLREVCGHVSALHNVDGEISREVNSYHTLAVEKLPDELITMGKSPDGVIEGIRHESLPIYGIMWHPERASDFDARDIALIQKLFQ